MSFTERVLALIQEKGTTKNKLLMELGLGKNSFVDWTEKGNLPNGATIIKIADYFGVTTDYLLKGIESQSNTISTNSGQIGVVGQSNAPVTLNGNTPAPTAETLELLSIYEGLDVKRRVGLLQTAFSLKDEMAAQK